MFKIKTIINTFLVGVLCIKFAISISANCGKIQWKCDDGQCIAIEDLCDGVQNCADGSDETVEHCIRFKCPAYAFRCAYGACILGKHMCNGIQDCVDGSDETQLLCDTSLGQVGKQKILQGDCKNPLQLECKKGECIERDSICDGKVDCSNGKDETVELCSSVQCKSFAFRCGYGGCIAGNLRCNGIKDCADGSDEGAELCESTEVLPFCFVPSEHKNLEIINMNGSKRIQFGDRVIYGTRLKFKCPKGLHLVGATRSVCDFDGWSNQLPYCTKYCSNYLLHRSLSTTSICKYNEIEISCHGPLFPGTVARMSCAPGYMLDERINEPTTDLQRCNGEGKWSGSKMRCVPLCGITNDLKSQVMPWDVSIFRWDNEYIFQCYGTILSAKIIITAQSCFRTIQSADIDEHELYNIVVGQYSKDFMLNDDIGRPVFNVSEINMPYERDQTENIAILILVKFFEFSKTLAPICIQFKAFETTPYKYISQSSNKVDGLKKFGASVAEVKKSGETLIYVLNGVWGAVLGDSRLISVNVSGTANIIRKYIERYENIY